MSEITPGLSETTEALPPVPGVEAARTLDRRPARVWTVFAVAVAAMVAAFVLASGAAAVAAVVFVLEGTPVEELEARITEFLGTSAGLLTVVIPSQIGSFAVVLAAASRSREGVRARLGLGRGRVPAWGVVPLMGGAIFVSVAWNLVLWMILGDVGEGMEELNAALASGVGATALAVLLVLSILPGIAEELLFRGYVQRRLVTRWGPVVAIAISTMMFAAAHGDPRHAGGVMALGVWLGIISWRAGAVWLCMACHFANNLFGIGMMQLAGPEDLAPGVSPWNMSTFVFLAIGGVAFAGSVVLLVRARPVVRGGPTGQLASPAA
jgi:membrane protease YdiL (CAAX protease family)